MDTMESEFVLARAREFLGLVCDPQLRLVSRRWRDALATVPRANLKMEHYMTTVSLFLWARKKLKMRETADIAAMAAEGGFLEVLKWLRKRSRCSWSVDIFERAAKGRHLHVLKWLRTLKPLQPLDEHMCLSAALGWHLHLIQWLRAQNPPCPWDVMCTEGCDHQYVSYVLFVFICLYCRFPRDPRYIVP
jgi:hypothetical protein